MSQFSIQPEEKKKSKSEHRELVECKENGIKSDFPFNESCSPIDRPHKSIIKKPNTLCSNYHLFVTPINPATPFSGYRFPFASLKCACSCVCQLTVCVVDSGAMPSLLMVSLKVYSTPASSSEPEIPNTGPLDPRPKFRLEQCSVPCRQALGHHVSRVWRILLRIHLSDFHSHWVLLCIDCIKMDRSQIETETNVEIFDHYI